MLTERIIRLNDKVRNTEPTIDLDRARLITEFYSQPSMENYVLRRAKAFKYFSKIRKSSLTRTLRSPATQETVSRPSLSIRM